MRLYVKGKATEITTVISRGRRQREYGNDLLLWLKRELKLDTFQQLSDLINCPMEYKDYIKHLINERGLKI